MKNSWLLSVGFLAVIILFNCTAKSVKYDLPSAGTAEKPQWLVAHKVARDTIFIMINLPNEKAVDLDRSVQRAQSELHTILIKEIEIILREFWIKKGTCQSDEELFRQLSKLPLTIEHIMHNVVVTDGWERSGQIAILCALDYEVLTEVIMTDMDMEDSTFPAYLKGCMDDLAKRYH